MKTLFLYERKALLSPSVGERISLYRQCHRGLGRVRDVFLEDFSEGVLSDHKPERIVLFDAPRGEDVLAHITSSPHGRHCDFILDLASGMEPQKLCPSGAALIGRRVRFVGQTIHQKKILSPWVKRKSCVLFGGGGMDMFYHNPSLGKKWRKKFAIPPDTFVLCFAVTEGGNGEFVWELFQSLCQIREKSVLFFVGPLEGNSTTQDPLLNEFFGKKGHLLQGERRVFLLPSLEPPLLNELYNGCDCHLFTTLGGEDSRRACKSLRAGITCVMPQGSGHKDLEGRPGVHLVPVATRTLHISSPHILKLLFLRKRPTEIERQRISLKAKEWYHVGVDNLLALLKRKGSRFSGFLPHASFF